jgi:hypothetical protein
MSRSYKGIYSQENIHVTFFKNIAINHGYKSRSSRVKPEGPDWGLERGE